MTRSLLPGLRALLFVSALVAAAPAAGVTYDLGAGIPQGFAAVNDGGLWSFSEVPGDGLHVTKEAEDGTLFPKLLLGGLRTTQALSGDFFVSLDYREVMNPFGTQVQSYNGVAIIAANAADPSDFYYMSTFFHGASFSGIGFGRNPTSDLYGLQQPASLGGTIFLRRTQAADGSYVLEAGVGSGAAMQVIGDHTSAEHATAGGDLFITVAAYQSRYPPSLEGFRAHTARHAVLEALTMDPAAVPEPGAAALVALAVGAIAARARRRR